MNSDWQAFLQAQGATFVADVLGFPSDRGNASHAASETIIVPLTHLGLISAAGEEAASFLHNLGSNDVKKLPADRAQHNSLNSPKGRMLANFLLWHSEGGFVLALSADIQAAILKRLSMYVLRAKVRLTDADGGRVLLGLAGPQAATLLAACGLTAPAEVMGVAQGETRVIRVDSERYMLECPTTAAIGLWQTLSSAGATAAGTAAWRRLDIQAGFPLVTAATQDEFVAQMLNFELLGGVNFQKGCYPGQEIVARTQYLSKLKKRMFRAHIPDGNLAAMGDDLYAPEFGAQSCGKVVTAEAAPQGGTDLLAVMQISAFEAGEVHLGAPDGPRLTLGTLPYTID